MVERSHEKKRQFLHLVYRLLLLLFLLVPPSPPSPLPTMTSSTSPPARHPLGAHPPQGQALVDEPAKTMPVLSPHLQPFPRVSKRFFLALLGPALFHTIDHISTCVSFSKVAISFTHVFKASEPIFFVVFSAFLGRFWVSCGTPLSWVMESVVIMATALANGDGKPPDMQDFVSTLTS